VFEQFLPDPMDADVNCCWFKWENAGMAGWWIYGANGYTGGLIAREAAHRGLRPTLAGRNGPAVAALAAERGLDHRVFGLDEPAALVRGIEGHSLVLNCAGPFSHTAESMANACLHARAHYLDITGEERVLEAMAQRDAEARAARVMLLLAPGSTSCQLTAWPRTSSGGCPRPRG
jgi:short subunit dehydrogenase-like uncharacterized protein